jgi:hypothetical protein
VVGHSQKGCCKSRITKEPIRCNELERLVVIVVESQPTRHSYHITYADQVIELGRHEEEG